MVGTADVVYLALDGMTLENGLKLAGQVKERIYGVKLHDLVDEVGPATVAQFKSRMIRVWHDAKLKDIPTTVRLRAEKLHKNGAGTLSVHADGEIDMMMAAKECGAVIYAITELTSLDDLQISLLSGRSTLASVLYKARLAKLAGVDGVICSAREVGYLSKRLELKGLRFVVPGTRSAGVAMSDQARSDTPYAAILNGATKLVIGREVTAAEDPIAALDRIEEQIDRAFTELINQC